MLIQPLELWKTDYIYLDNYVNTVLHLGMYSHRTQNRLYFKIKVIRICRTTPQFDRSCNYFYGRVCFPRSATWFIDQNAMQWILIVSRLMLIFVSKDNIIYKMLKKTIFFLNKSIFVIPSCFQKKKMCQNLRKSISVNWKKNYLSLKTYNNNRCKIFYRLTLKTLWNLLIWCF